MLNHLKKLFSATAEQPAALAAPQEEDKSMSAQEGQSAGDINTAELVAQLASATDALATQDKAFAELTAKFEQMQAALAVIEADKAQMIADAKETQLSTRLGQLSVVIGDVKAAELNAKLADADEATFNTVMSSLALSYELEAKSSLFTEQGVSAEVAPVEQDAVQKLAASLAAQFNVK